MTTATQLIAMVGLGPEGPIWMWDSTGSWFNGPTPLWSTWQTSSAPSMAVFDGRVHLAMIGLDGNVYLGHAGANLSQWSGPTAFFPSMLSGAQGVSLAAGPNGLYLAVLCGGVILVSTSSDGQVWRRPQPVSAPPCLLTPSIAAGTQGVYLAMVQTDSNVYVAWSSDGMWWGPPVQQSAIGSTDVAVCLAASGDNLALGYVKGNVPFVSWASSASTGFPSGTQAFGGWRTWTALCATCDSSTLYLGMLGDRSHPYTYVGSAPVGEVPAIPDNPLGNWDTAFPFCLAGGELSEPALPTSGFCIQTHAVTGNNTATFNFGADVNSAALAYGIQQMTLQGSSTTAKLDEIGISLSLATGYPSGSVVKIVQKIKGNWAAPDSCTTWITVLAYVGGSPSGNVLVTTTAKAVDVGTPGLPIACPTDTPYDAVAALTSFDFSFYNNSGDPSSSDVVGIGVSCGVAADITTPGSVVPGLQGTLTGDSPFTGTGSLAVFATDSTQAGIALDVVPAASEQPTTNFVTPTYFNGAPIRSAAALIQSFFAQFPIDLSPTPRLYQLSVGVAPTQLWINSPAAGQVTIAQNLSLTGYVPTGQPQQVGAANFVCNQLLIVLPVIPDSPPSLA